jgi:asparagine synthase (glutamine-hydrolysing)
MCGISGILSADPNGVVDAKLLASMTHALNHRGPDAQRQWIKGPVGLGHNRLAIIDLSTGDQPMRTPDGRATIVFNGEIYNFKDVRKELEAGGTTFRTSSDTEVILQAYVRWGVGCLAHIEGMFAFALWDARENRLLLARDRLGVKPLLYAMSSRGLAFASEAKALLTWLGTPEVDTVALHEYLLFGSCSSPRAFLKGVRKLPPAHAAWIAPGEAPAPSRYWEPHFAPPLTGTPAQIRGELREKVAASVRRQLVSDVPVGAYLSGGLDSSIVVSMMAGEFREQVDTFSVGGRGFAQSELPYAKMMSNRLGVRHHPLEIDRRDFLEALPDVAWHNDEPTADPALVPLYLLSRLARSKVTVVLCGEGADEVFAGYGHYPGACRRIRRLRAAGALPAPVRRAAFGLLGLLRGRERMRQLERLADNARRDPFAIVLRGPPELDARVMDLLGDDGQVDSAKSEYRAALGDAILETGDPLEVCLRADMRVNLADFLLVRADNMAMAHGLEARVPFLDEIVVDFATRLPANMKLDGVRGKAILRDVFRDLLPQEIVHRPKAPFPVPLAHWVLSDAALLERTLVGGVLTESGLIERGSLARFLASGALAPASASPWDCMLAWRLFYLEVWARRFLRNERVQLNETRTEH